MDVDVIIKMGFFIRDLHRQIAELHAEQFDKDDNRSSFTVYRGQGFLKTDLDQLRKTKRGLLSFNTFLSTSKNRAFAVKLAESAQKITVLVGVLFVMNIDPSISFIPFASIKDFSDNKESDDEILFSMHSVFRICDIKQIDNNDRLWQVNLTLTSDTDPQLNTLTERIREETQGPSGWHRLGEILLKLGQFTEAEDVYNILLSQTKNDRERSILYDQLGRAKYGQGEYQQAMTFYETSLKSRQKTLPPNHPDLAQSYSKLGLVYDNMGEYSKAMSYQEKALEIRQKTLPSNHPDLGASYNNIGVAYNNMQEYSKALSFHEKALKIRQQNLPPNHPGLGETYYNVGLVNENMGEHSKALSFCKQAVETGQHSPPRNHPNLQRWQKTLEIVRKKVLIT
jgi:tetratricopeptide (TPR) repeat protein